MRKIIVTEFMSLDGVIDNPMWSLRYWNDEIAQFKRDEDAVTEALLLGRVTYEGFAQAWPDSDDEGAPRINSMPKYVTTNTLTTLEWNNSHVISGDVVAGIKALREQDGLALLVYGSAELIKTLMAHDLVDSYRLLIYPEIIGSGKRLFPDDFKTSVRLVELRQLTGGVIAAVYEPIREG